MKKTIILLIILLVSIATANALTAEVEGNFTINRGTSFIENTPNWTMGIKLGDPSLTEVLSGQARTLYSGFTYAPVTGQAWETEPVFVMVRSDSIGTILSGGVLGDTHRRWLAQADGKIFWGDGTSETGFDTNLYRSAADTLKTDDSFVSSGLTVNGQSTMSSSSYPVLRVERTSSITSSVLSAMDMIHTTSGDMADGFGSQMTFSIKDDAATPNIVGAVGARRDGADNTGELFFTVVASGSQSAKATLDHNGQFALPIQGSSGGLVIGTDTNLYRSAANILYTDDSLIVAQKIAVGDNTLVGLTTGDINVSTVYYDSLQPKSPILFETDKPEPICMKADNNRYVACMPKYKDGKYEWACEENIACDEKINKLETYRTEQRELDRLREECESKQVEGKIFIFDRKTKECNEIVEPTELIS